MKGVVEIFPTKYISKFDNYHGVPYVNITGKLPNSFSQVDFELQALTEQLKNSLEKIPKKPKEITPSVREYIDIDMIKHKNGPVVTNGGKTKNKRRKTHKRRKVNKRRKTHRK